MGYPNKGGIEGHVREMSERLARKYDAEIMLLSADLSSNNSHNDEIKGVIVKRFKPVSQNNAYFIAPQIYSYLKKSYFLSIASDVGENAT